ncbi:MULTISPECIES: hypothetical protein [unclassified Marinovum]
MKTMNDFSDKARMGRLKALDFLNSQRSQRAQMLKQTGIGGRSGQIVSPFGNLQSKFHAEAL